MRKHISAMLAALLMLLCLLPLVGCARIEDELDQRFPEPTVEEETPVEVEDEFPARTKRTYTVLLTTQLKNADQLTGIALLTLDTAEGKIHWLEIPTDLFIHAVGDNLQGHYGNAYRVEQVKEGSTSLTAMQAGVNALRNLLSTGFQIPIDYSVNLDAEQLSDLIKTIGNIPLTLPESMGGLGAGNHTLGATGAIDFLTYTRYADPVEGQINAHIRFAAAMWQQMRTKVTAENLSLFSMEVRGMMTTDIPNTGGEDIFFLRKFLRTEPADFAITYLTAQKIYFNGKQTLVMLKENARRQLNEQMLVYEEALSDPQFDPSGVFVDHANQMVAAVYTSSAPLPTLHTMAVLLGLEPEPEPGETDSPAE
ncbi:MAG: hypothetical protein IJW98_05165 [Clostridia bacterium]|nr:hypothetical protein [Clostridia bacterium]